MNNNRRKVIQANQIEKNFMVPHEKIDSLKGHMVGLFKQIKKEKYPVLKGVSFDVKEGEFFGVVGRNGSGKSTLLKILAGVYRPTKGSIGISGKMATFIELGVGFNFDLSGRDNIYLNGAILGMSRKDIEARFDDILAFSELEEFIDQKVKNYSSGMQVRLAFAVAIQADADIFLVDEVLAVGDSNFQKKCFAEFRKLKKAGKTIIFVSHDMDSIQRFCDRVMMLKDGSIELIGTPRQVALSYEIENINPDTRGRTLSRRTNGPIRIVSIKILNYKSNNKPVFDLSGNMAVRVNFRAKNNRQIIVALSISTVEDGKYLVGYNTKNELGVINTKIGMNCIECTLPTSQFAKGSYNVNAAIFSYESFELIDYFDSSQGMITPTVNIIEKDESKDGDFNLSGKWRLISE